MWDWFGLGHLTPHYADLVAILAAGQADAAGLDPYAVPNPFDPFGRPHVYGPWWLLTGRLGLEVIDAWWLGGVLALVFVIVAPAALRPTSASAAAWTAAFLVTPPVMLGLERGNNDLIVFVILALAAWQVARASSTGTAFGAALVGLAAGLKIYPIVAVPVLAQRLDRWRSMVGVGVVGLLVWLAVGGEWLAGLRRAMAAAPEPETIFAHGVSILGYTWSVLPSMRGVFVAILVLAVAGVAVWIGRDWRRLWRAVPINDSNGVFFAAGALPWIFCFVVTSNFPYRLVLVLLPVRLWLAQNAQPEQARVARVQLILWLIAAWLLAPKHWAIAALQSEPQGTLLWVTLIVAVEQGIILALTAAMSCSALGWLTRQLRWHLRKPAEPDRERTVT